MDASLYAIHQWNSMNLLSLIPGKKKCPVFNIFLTLLGKVSIFTNALQLEPYFPRDLRNCSETRLSPVNLVYVVHYLPCNKRVYTSSYLRCLYVESLCTNYIG